MSRFKLVSHKLPIYNTIHNTLPLFYEIRTKFLLQVILVSKLNLHITLLTCYTVMSLISKSINKFARDFWFKIDK